MVFTCWDPESLQVSWVLGSSGFLSPGDTVLMSLEPQGPSDPGLWDTWGSAHSGFSVSVLGRDMAGVWDRGCWPLTFPPVLVTLDGHHCFLGVSRPYPNLKPSLSCVLMSPEVSWSHSVGLSLDEPGGLSASLWVGLSSSHWAPLHVDLSHLCISLVHLCGFSSCFCVYLCLHPFPSLRLLASESEIPGLAFHFCLIPGQVI